MKSPALTRYLLAISLALNLGVLVALVLNTAPWAAPRNSQTPTIHLPDHLALSPQQRAQWQSLESPFLRDLAANWSDVRRHREALVRQVFGPTPDRATIEAEQAAIGQLQAAQQKRVIEQLLAEREVLDEHQRTLLLQLLLARYAQEPTQEELLHKPGTRGR